MDKQNGPPPSPASAFNNGARPFEDAAPSAPSAAPTGKLPPSPFAAQKSDLTVSDVMRRLGPAGPLAVWSAAIPALGGFLLLGSLYWLGPWLRAHPEGVVLYVAGFAVFAGLALLPTYAQAVLGGWAFGFAVGFPAALGGFLGGSFIGYLIARRAAGDRVVRLIGEHAKWKAVYDALLGSGFGKALLIVTLLRVPPNSPFAMTNLVLAATRVPLLIYLLGTLVGMAPRTALTVYIAAGLQTLDFTQGGSKWIFIGGIVAALIVIAIIGRLAQNAIAKVTANHGK